MANKITELTAATTPLAGTELAWIEQGGLARKVAVSEFGGGGGGLDGTAAESIIGEWDFTAAGGIDITLLRTSTFTDTATNLGRDADQPLSNFTVVGDWAGLRQGAQRFLNTSSTGAPTTNRYFINQIGNRDTLGGYAVMAYGQSTQEEIYYGYSPDSSSLPTWIRIPTVASDVGISGDWTFTGAFLLERSETTLMRTEIRNTAGSGNRQTDLHINAQAGEDFYFGVNYTGVAGAFFDNRTTGDFSWRFTGTERMSLTSGGLLGVSSVRVGATPSTQRTLSVTSGSIVSTTFEGTNATGHLVDLDVPAGRDYNGIRFLTAGGGTAFFGYDYGEGGLVASGAQGAAPWVTFGSSTMTLDVNLNTNANYIYTPSVTDVQNFANVTLGHVRPFFGQFQVTGSSASVGGGNYVSGFEFRHALSDDYRSQMTTYSTSGVPSLVMRHKINGAWGSHYAAAFRNYDETITGEWSFSTVNVTELLSTIRGVTGKYEDDPSSAWGGTIYGMGSAFDGAVSGVDSVSTSVYGLRWLRNAHAEADSRIGEGMYVYQNGALEGGIGAGGVYSAGPMECIANLRTRADLIIGASTDRRVREPTLRGTIDVGGPTDNGGFGAYHGYSINNDIMFMHNGTAAGIYDEINNNWKIRFDTDRVYTDIYYGSGIAMRTKADGIQLVSPNTNNASIDFLTGAGVRTAYIQSISTTDFVFQHEVHGGRVLIRGEDAAGTIRAFFEADPDGNTGIYENATHELAFTTQGRTGSHSTSAQVRHRNGLFYDVGKNQMPRLRTNESFTMGVADVGGMAYYNNSTNYTITLNNDSNIKNDSRMDVLKRGGSGTLTFSQGTGVTITKFDGSTTITTGNIVIAASTVAWLTIHKYDATNYFITGGGMP